MENIKLSIDKAFGFVSEQNVANYKVQVNAANAALHNASGKGSDFLGWLNLPTSIDEAHLNDVENTAKILRDNCEVVVVIGIGGSYLGSKAVIDALSNSFDWLQTERKSPVVVYAGQNIGEDYLYELQELLKTKKFGIISISKSGTTTEPALAFRLLKTQLEEQQGKA
ncbi:MAG: glucose-6-phosphate isomerase, partial [Paludibacter sp.]